jgi:hypothetical protein
MKKLNKTDEYNKLRKIAADNGMNQYAAAAAAMELVLYPTLAKSIVLDYAVAKEAQRRG